MAKERPRLHLLKRNASPEDTEARPATSPWVIALVAAVTLLACALLLIPTPQHVPQYAAGETVEREIISPRDLTVPDLEATNAAKKRARLQIPAVYDLLPTETDLLVRRVEDAFASIRALRYAGPLSKPDSEPTADELLRTRLGILPPEHLQHLSPSRFTRRLETELISALRQPLERGVLMDRDDVPGGPNSEILVRTVGEPRESYVKLRNLPELAEARASLERVALQVFADEPDARALMTFLGQSLLFANLSENRKETQLRRETAAARVKPLFIHIKKGDVLVPAGSQVLHTQELLLNAFAESGEEVSTQTVRVIGLGILCGLIFFVFYLDLKGIRSRVLTELPRALVTAIVLVGTLALCRLTLFLLGAFTAQFEAVDAIALPYALPVAAGAMLVTLLLNVRTALVFSMMASILMGLMVPEVPLFTLYGFITSLVGVFAVSGCQRRSQLASAGLWVGFMSAAVVAGIDLQQATLISPERLYDLPFAFCGGILAAVIVSAALPVLELAFNLPTNIRLLELSDLNHPLLRMLLERAPGTYHHSMIMSNMAEQAAKAIGDNALLARVGCYYHDIGKMLKPAYFIENQWGGENNLHDNLSPSMSRLVLVSHVKDGIELARKHNLPQEVIDMIPQHHGTRLINYFFEKAKESTQPGSGQPNEENFRYPGPKPQTKVGGIIMAADTVEAASRVLDDPSPARIGVLVDKVVNTIYLDQQLDDCELTLKDLRKIADSFVKTLTGTFHHRIQYPGMQIPASGQDAGPSDESPASLPR
ncbi:MAG: HD family phosphohydrolase [Leptospirillia bacterium]